IGQEPEGEERRGPLRLDDGAEEAVEEREIAVEKRGADRGGHRELHDGRCVERTQLRGQEADRPEDRSHSIVLSSRAALLFDRSMPSSISFSISREYLISVASHSFGKSDPGVQPGTVLISLTK